MKRPSRPSNSGVGPPLGAKLASLGVLPTSTQRPAGEALPLEPAPGLGTHDERTIDAPHDAAARRSPPRVDCARDGSTSESRSNARLAAQRVGVGLGEVGDHRDPGAPPERERERRERQIAHQQPVGTEARELLAQRRATQTGFRKNGKLSGPGSAAQPHDFEAHRIALAARAAGPVAAQQPDLVARRHQRAGHLLDPHVPGIVAVEELQDAQGSADARSCV